MHAVLVPKCTLMVKLLIKARASIDEVSPSPNPNPDRDRDRDRDPNPDPNPNWRSIERERLPYTWLFEKHTKTSTPLSRYM